MGAAGDWLVARGRAVVSLFVEQDAPRRIIIGCDHSDCRAHLDNETIAAGGGLIEMGWLRRFNSETRRNEYFCPKHHPEKEESRGN
jgi:hypothetical protein